LECAFLSISFADKFESYTDLIKVNWKATTRLEHMCWNLEKSPRTPVLNEHSVWY